MHLFFGGQQSASVYLIKYLVITFLCTVAVHTYVVKWLKLLSELDSAELILPLSF